MVPSPAAATAAAPGNFSALRVVGPTPDFLNQDLPRLGWGPGFEPALQRILMQLKCGNLCSTSSWSPHDLSLMNCLTLRNEKGLKGAASDTHMSNLVFVITKAIPIRIFLHQQRYGIEGENPP